MDSAISNFLCFALKLSANLPLCLLSLVRSLFALAELHTLFLSWIGFDFLNLCLRYASLVIYFLSVCDSYDLYYKLLTFNFGNDSIIAHTPSPIIVSALIFLQFGRDVGFSARLKVLKKVLIFLIPFGSPCCCFSRNLSTLRGIIICIVAFHLFF